MFLETMSFMVTLDTLSPIVDREDPAIEDDDEAKSDTALISNA